jgi:hypothetical protein
VLADKGYCGTSGATAPAGTALWHVAPDGDARSRTKAGRFAMGGALAGHAWMDRVLEQTWLNGQQLAEWGYPFPVDSDGEERRNSLHGPEYMRLIRKRVKEAGAKILDHSPALELLVDDSGAVAGAAGVNRQISERWIARARAVAIATGGCAFQSRALGCNVLTGGDLAAHSLSIDALVQQNARALDRSANAIRKGASNAEELVLEGALATAKTQLVVSKLPLYAGERLFEVGGASATARSHNFDRHWRNLRTIFSHNPLLHKPRVIDDYELNGVTTHLTEGRVF